MGVLKRKRLWIYLSDQDQETVTKLAEMCAPLKESDLCSALVAAALPSLHTPDQVRATLEFARKYDLNICRAMAVKYFAGLRSSEVNLLEEQEIGELYIEVTAAKAKTRKRRLVSVQPNLSAWLALGGELPIRDQSNRWRWFTDALLEKTGVPWPKNVTRHTFVSYYLAKFQNAAKAALEAGHTEQMLFANYREITTREAAEQFWAIVPK